MPWASTKGPSQTFSRPAMKRLLDAVDERCSVLYEAKLWDPVASLDTNLKFSDAKAKTSQLHASISEKHKIYTNTETVCRKILTSREKTSIASINKNLDELPNLHYTTYLQGGPKC